MRDEAALFRNTAQVLETLAASDVQRQASSATDGFKDPFAPAQLQQQVSAEKPQETRPAGKPAQSETSTNSARLGTAVAAILANVAGTRAAPQSEVTETREGTLINLTDRDGFSMFASGSAQPNAALVRMLASIGAALKSTPGAIVVRGFTDARPFHSVNYDNWRLSSARAQIIVYMLQRGGLDDARIASIEGHGDRGLRDRCASGRRGKQARRNPHPQGQAVRRIYAALILCGMAMPALAEPDTPARLLRELQSAQTDVALGRSKDISQQTRLLADLKTRLPQFASETWQDPRNARALASYLLNGGSADVVKTILGGSQLTIAERPLIDAALAWSERREDDARKLFSTFDPRSVPSDVAGQVALVEASLSVANDRPKAIALLDLARLLMPGTLVEEAALRRRLFLADDNDPPTRVSDLVRRYRERFPDSMYRDNFEQRVRDTIIGMWMNASETARATLLPVIADMRQGKAFDIWIAIARSALIAGRLDITKDAAARALVEPSVPAGLRRQAILYLAIADAIRGDAGSALDAVSVSDLSGDDRGFQIAATTIVANIRKPIGPPPATDPVATPGDRIGETILRASSLAQDRTP